MYRNRKFVIRVELNTDEDGCYHNSSVTDVTETLQKTKKTEKRKNCSLC